MTEQDTLTPISDQTNLIEDQKEDTSLTTTIFFLLKLVPILLALVTTVLKDSQTSSHICLAVSAAFLLTDMASTKMFFGKKMVGISWYFSFSNEDSSIYSFDILPEPEMPTGSDVNAFWIALAVPLIFWLIIPFFILANTNWIMFLLFFILFILQVLNFIIFLKGNALAAKQSAEAVRTVLLGNVDEFEELPEQATIESVSKQQPTQETEKEKEDHKEEAQKEDNQTAENGQKEEIYSIFCFFVLVNKYVNNIIVF